MSPMARSAGWRDRESDYGPTSRQDWEGGTKVRMRGLPGSPGLPAFTRYDDVTEAFDGVLVTDLKQARAVFDDAVKRFGPDHVVAPSLLGAYRRSVVNGEQE